MPPDAGRAFRIRTPRRASYPQFEPLEHRRALAVGTTAPIDDVAMSIGSAAQPIVIRLGDHFQGGGAALDYTVTSTYGYVTTVVDGRGDLTIRASAAVPPGFVTAIDPLVVRATSRTNPNDYRELRFTVFQKAPVRLGNAILTRDGSSLGIGNTMLRNGSTDVVLNVPAALPKPAVTGKVRDFVGDFNGDHADDVAWLDSRNQLWVSPATDGTRFQSVARWGELPSGQRWQTVTVGDFNGDSLSDIAARNSRTGDWHVLLSDGSGLKTAVAFGNWSTRVPWRTIVTGDFDGNGSTDLAARNPYTGQWVISRSRGDRFAITKERGFGVGDWRSIAVGDVNGDGRADLMARNSGTGAWVVLVSQGGRFAAPTTFGKWSTAVAWQDVFLGDFDGDGRADIAGRRPRTGEWVVSRSTGSSFVTAPFGGRDAFAAGRTFVAGDYNFDGKTDILARDANTGIWRMLPSTGSRFAASFTVGMWPTTAARSGITPLRISYGLANSGGSPVNGSPPGWISSGSMSIGSGNIGSGGILISSGGSSSGGSSSGIISIGSGNWLPATGTLSGTGSYRFATALTGIFAGPLTLTGSGVVKSPSYGTRWFTTLGTSQEATFGPKGFYTWNVDAAQANGTAGTNWDLFRVGGVLDITATAAEPFDLFVSVIPAQSGERFDASQAYAWTIVEAAGGIIGFAPDKFTIKNGTAGTQPGPLAGGQFTLVQVGNTLQLRYTPPALG
jgi:hypothetical protein